MLLIEAKGEDDEPLSYEIVAEIKKPRVKSVRPRPPPRPPEMRRVLGEVLEVEKCEGKPCSVLIDKGRPEGIREGQSGKLVEKGKAIAKIEIVDVYDAGSRAQILGSLEATITIDTQAEIEVPK